ncbi:hypothetical protein HanXRQr2_Chr15g0699021 [Helianthus annuus]|uniref:Transmembrane protein n=1 Tax=Helianthus annuus TaxID=4232 RepID=A0A9K3E127_HELAN|nr:hypothetical protein HanXRQr2_Chr15g0699021 [Helianthus annuus]KAJ0649099.1 hypothetical protein HanLR1_Chr15g0580381 [Helianthus annuus]KAJ0831754.1 hypothetical protein HanPSC8_Chr15g0670761 [Helianthus annuus]
MVVMVWCWWQVMVVVVGVVGRLWCLLVVAGGVWVVVGIER